MLGLQKSAAEISKLGRKFARSTDGIAAVEFALIFPLFLVIFYGVAEIANYNMIKRRAHQSIDFAVEYISRDDDNMLTSVERMNALDIWAIVNPTSHMATNSDAGRRATGYSRSFAAVEFNPKVPGCMGASCEYEPEVQWTFFWGQQWAEQPVSIQCTLTVVANNMKLDGNKIPEGMLGRSSVVMGDYTFKYKPIFKNNFLAEQDVHVSAIRKTRGSDAIAHPQSQGGTQC